MGSLGYLVCAYVGVLAAMAIPSCLMGSAEDSSSEMQHLREFLSRYSAFTVLVVFIGLWLCIVAFEDPFPRGPKLVRNKDRIAWSECRILLMSCMAYQKEKGKLPVSLQDLADVPQPVNVNLEEFMEALSKRKTAFVNQSDLIDPWGRPYQYKQRGEHSTDGDPEIYSLGPDPDNPQEMIGSWMPKPPSRW